MSSCCKICNQSSACLLFWLLVYSLHHVHFPTLSNKCWQHQLCARHLQTVSLYSALNFPAHLSFYPADCFMQPSSSHSRNLMKKLICVFNAWDHCLYVNICLQFYYICSVRILSQTSLRTQSICLILFHNIVSPSQTLTSDYSNS